MAATKDDISHWFDVAKCNGFAYMLVVCDTFDHSDYPVCAKDAKEAREKYTEHDNKNMQRVMEVYDCNADKAEQMAERRAMRLPALAT